MANTQNNNRITFLIKPEWPMDLRVRWIIGLIGVGIVVQFFVHILLGWLFVLAGALLGMVGGRNIAPRTSGKAEWQTTTIEELENIQRLSERTRSWQEKTQAYSAGTGAGCGAFLVALVLMVFGGFLISNWLDGPGRASDGTVTWWFRAPLRGGRFLPMWILDCIAMVIPIWFSGGMTAWKPKLLTEKAEYLLTIHRRFKADPDLEFLPSLSVKKSGDRTVPSDCRMLVKLKDAPEDLIGIQVQVSMNKVQSKEYPYCYAVIIAKKSFGLRRKADPILEPPDSGGFLGLGKLFMSENDRKESVFARFDDSIAEIDAEADADVLVVRQKTSGEGYHTTLPQAEEVFRDALTLTRAIIGA